MQASGSVITEYLEALPTIGPGGVVTTLYGLQACLASGQSYFQVQFLQNFGSLPLMVADYSQLGANGLITVSVFQAGNLALRNYINYLHLQAQKKMTVVLVVGCVM